MLSKKLIEEALALPLEERTQVVLQILDSLEPADAMADLSDEAWRAEIERRANQALSGQSQSQPWADVEHRARQKLNSSRSQTSIRVRRCEKLEFKAFRLR